MISFVEHEHEDAWDKQSIRDLGSRSAYQPSPGAGTHLLQAQYRATMSRAREWLLIVKRHAV